MNDYRLTKTKTKSSEQTINNSVVELRMMSNKLQLLGNAEAFFVATDANAPRRR